MVPLAVPTVETLWLRPLEAFITPCVKDFRMLFLYASPPLFILRQVLAWRRGETDYRVAPSKGVVLEKNIVTLVDHQRHRGGG